MNVTDEIKERLDIVEFIGSYVPLQKAGRNFKALCPFHSEKTPSFYVFPDSQRWQCFGACSEGGDVFSFAMKREGWDFRTALEELARRAGVELVPQTPAQVEAEERTERLRATVAEAARYYHHLLQHAPQAEHAREYLAQRSLSPATIDRFQLGYSLPGWENLRDHLIEQGFTLEELLQAGLLVEREDGSAYDRFRDRLMIPIRDAQGHTIGFGARTLDREGVPKYLNSPKTPIFDKSHTLFGLDLAREAIRAQERVVIVEGYMDVMQAHQAGFHNIVAQMGTALTETQVRRLQRYTRRFILALDPDAAGVQATLRGLEVARETLEREWEPVFDPRGLVGFEGRLGAEIRILRLPSGYDPDDLIRSDPTRWSDLVQEAAPVVEFYLHMLLEQIELDDAKERARVVETMLPLLRDVVDPVERETYAQKLARSLHIQPQTVLDRLQTTERRAARQTQPAAAPPTPRHGPARADIEAYCLAMFLQRDKLLPRVNHLLEEAGIPPLQAQDFSEPIYRAILQSWQEALSSGAVVSQEELIAQLPASLADRMEPLRTSAQDLAEEQWIREGIQAVLRLRERNLRQTGTKLRELLQEASEAEWAEANQYGQALAENARAILQVQQFLHARRWIAVGATETPEGYGGAVE